MFTGIIEELGTVKSLSVYSEAAQLTINAKRIMSDVRLGDSIAVNGICLTVVSFTKEEFVVDVMPETLRKTNLKDLKVGHSVNLERAMMLGGRLGGHLVSGHVDGVGRIESKRQEGNAIVFYIAAPPEALKFIVPKGSVAIDGISLTVAHVGRDSFSVSVVPHTATQTTLGSKLPGDAVNLENDMIGKYVDRLLNSYQDVGKTNINIDFLKANGFLQ